MKMNKDIDNLKKNLNIFEEKKDLIAKEWLLIDRVKARLIEHKINPEFFEKHFAIKVIEYFLSVIKGDSNIGHCPTISVMLMFFKGKKITVNDIFVICDGLKEALLVMLLNEEMLDESLLREMFYVKNSNFVGVLRDCAYMNIPLDIENGDGFIGEKIQKEEIILTQSNEDIVLTTPKKELKTYDDYVIDNDLAELKELEEEIDSLGALITMNHTNGGNSEQIDEMSENLDKYGHILTTYPLFENLGFNIKELSINIKDLSEVELSENKINMLSALIESFIHDLIMWRKSLFEVGVTNPHEFDNSIISSVDTISKLLSKDENINESSDDNEMELF